LSRERRSRIESSIERMLRSAGWSITDAPEAGNALGIAVRQFQVGQTVADYALFVDRRLMGLVEAKGGGLPAQVVARQVEHLTGELASAGPDTTIRGHSRRRDGWFCGRAGWHASVLVTGRGSAGMVVGMRRNPLPPLADRLLPDALWQRIRPLLPPPPGGGAPRTVPDRACMAAIIFMCRTSTPLGAAARQGAWCGSVTTCWRRLPSGRPPGCSTGCRSCCWTSWARRGGWTGPG
jgi:transposase